VPLRIRRQNRYAAVSKSRFVQYVPSVRPPRFHRRRSRPKGGVGMPVVLVATRNDDRKVMSMSTSLRKDAAGGDPALGPAKPAPSHRNEAVRTTTVAADAWAIWITACRDVAARQIGLMEQLTNHFAERIDLSPAGGSGLVDLGIVRPVRQIRESCEHAVHGMREINDVAMRWYFNWANQAAGRVAEHLAFGRATQPDDPVAAGDKAP